jgi:hypothetical protein
VRVYLETFFPFNNAFHFFAASPSKLWTFLSDKKTEGSSAFGDNYGPSERWSTWLIGASEFWRKKSFVTHKTASCLEADAEAPHRGQPSRIQATWACPGTGLPDFYLHKIPKTGEIFTKAPLNY